LIDPRRLPSTGALWRAFARFPVQVPKSAFTLSDSIDGEPATVIAALPRRPGFRRSFTSQALSRRGARPLLVIHALFARGREGPHAACRLLQPCAIREHDHDRPSSAAPHPRSPAGAAMLSTVIALRRCAELRMAEPTCVSRPVETSRVRGLSETRRSLVGSSHRDRSRWKLCPNPIGSDTSCRRLVTIRRPETSTSSGAFAPATSLPRCPDAHASARPETHCRGLSGIGPPCAPSREGERAPLHPRCLPSSDRPFSGSRPAFHSLSPVCGVAGRRLFDPRPLPCP